MLVTRAWQIPKKRSHQSTHKQNSCVRRLCIIRFWDSVRRLSRSQIFDWYLTFGLRANGNGSSWGFVEVNVLFPWRLERSPKGRPMRYIFLFLGFRPSPVQESPNSSKRPFALFGCGPWNTTKPFGWFLNRLQRVSSFPRTTTITLLWNFSNDGSIPARTCLTAVNFLRSPLFMMGTWMIFWSWIEVKNASSHGLPLGWRWQIFQRPIEEWPSIQKITNHHWCDIMEMMITWKPIPIPIINGAEKQLCFYHSADERNI